MASLVAVAAVAGAPELVFGFARSVRLHNGLAGEFTRLEQDLPQAGEALAPARLRDLKARRLDIESREPPVLRVLNAMCHDGLVTALDIDDGERTNSARVQRLAPLAQARRCRPSAAASRAVKGELFHGP